MDVLVVMFLLLIFVGVILLFCEDFFDDIVCFMYIECSEICFEGCDFELLISIGISFFNLD